MAVCEKCGQVHKPTLGTRPCNGHTKSYKAMVGQTVCAMHGGKGARNRAKGTERAADERARQLMKRFAGPIDITPSQGMLDSICWVAGYVQFLRQQVERVTNDATKTDDLIWGKTKDKTGGNDAGTTYEAKPSAWSAELGVWQDRLTKLCTEAIRIGIEERKVRLAEKQGELVADVITRITGGILDALTTAGLTADLAKVFREALAIEAPRHLRLLTS
jgi:hypothetical protein